MFKKSMFGYSCLEVDLEIEALHEMIDLQRRDIEFLKRDNSVLKSTINALSSEKGKV